MVYFELQPDIFAEHVPKAVDPNLQFGPFMRGTLIVDPVATPIEFVTTHESGDPPKGYHGRQLPLMSKAFVHALQEFGIDNLQWFAARLSSSLDGTIWDEYFAANIVGLVSCVDERASKFKKVIDRPGASSSPLLVFEELKIDPNKVDGVHIFRLAESPRTVLVSGKLVDHLRAKADDEAWGITLDER